MAQEYWEVVGGEDKGGIIARAGKKLASEPLPEVLRVGSIIEELELAGNRLHFRLFAGSGPQEGWASVTLKQKYILLEKCSREKAEEKAKAHNSDASCLPAKTEPQTPEATVASEGDDNGGQGAGEAQDAESQEPFSEQARPDLDHVPPPKSEVKEAVPKSAEDWREEVNKQKKSGDKRQLARTLQDAAAYMLAHGLVEEALQLANDAVERWELLGYRVPLGIAWDTVAKAQLQLLQAQLGKAETEAEAGRAQERYAQAEAAAGQAVSLLRRIEEPQEEAHLASARYTLAEVRALAESVHVAGPGRRGAVPGGGHPGPGRATAGDRRGAAQGRHDRERGPAGAGGRGAVQAPRFAVAAGHCLGHRCQDPARAPEGPGQARLQPHGRAAGCSAEQAGAPQGGPGGILQGRCSAVHNRTSEGGKGPGCCTEDLR